MSRISQHRREATRLGFTLIELLITISIIGILAGLFLGALQRANGMAKVAHTKSTIAKLNASLMDRWDGYRNRRLPVDPVAVLQNIKASGGGAYPYVQMQIGNMVTRRSLPTDPLGVLSTSPLYPTNLQVAAVRLLAIRELMRYEMPECFDDFADMGGSPGSFQPRAPQVLTQWPVPTPPTIPGVAVTYLMRLNSATTTDINRIRANQSAECLYMILTTGSTDGGLFGEQLPTDDVGDVDGDGLPEFQDAWAVASSSFSANGRANSPIDFLRWAPGFVSPVQPNPGFPSFLDPPASPMEFSITNHDYFDPLKLDVPGTSAGAPPRGFQLTPLIYSAGPDGNWALHGNLSTDLTVMSTNDPYEVFSGVQVGAPVSGADDDITNHDLDTRAGK